jgi:hypothetical protein
MPILHLGQLQLEVGRPLAGIMIPPIDEQDTADIRKNAGHCRKNKFNCRMAMAKFSVGQEVEVQPMKNAFPTWFTAKIVRRNECEECGTLYIVEFCDTSTMEIDAEHIRARRGC